MWLHQAHYDLHKVTSKFDQTFQFVLKKYMLTRKTNGRKPEKVIFFFPLKNTQAFWVDIIPFQEMVSGFMGSIDNHFPKNKFLVELLSLQIEIPTYSIPSSRSISYVTLAFSDANKSKYEILIKIQNEEDITHVIPNSWSIQLGELLELLKIFVECRNEPISIFSENQYTVKSAQDLAFSRFPKFNCKYNDVNIKCVRTKKLSMVFVLHSVTYQIIRNFG